MKLEIPILLSIILLSAFLRLFQLGVNPPSLDWDEVSLGYNAYSLLKTGRDEYGNSWPLSIRSFNDYKPPAYAYLTIPAIAIFGLNEFSVRLPSAIAGLVAVITIYFLARHICYSTSHKSNSFSPLPLFSALFLAISPWHLQFSRAAFEANLALSFYLLSLLFFFTWLNQKPPLFSRHFSPILSALFAAASIYSYHSARLIIPVTFFILTFIYRRNIKQRLPSVFFALTIAAIFLSPLLITLTRGSIANRFNTVSVFTNPGEFSRERERIQRAAEFKAEHHGLLRYFHANKVVLATIVTRNYFEHFNFDFLFLRSDGNPRHHAAGMGLLYLANLPLILLGAYQLPKANLKHKLIVLIFLFIGPLAASLTASTPHAIRSLLMLPGFIFLAAFGASFLYATSFHWKKIIWSAYFLALSINIFYYLNLYYQVTPVEFASGWQYGYKQLVSRVGEYSKNFDQIIITRKYDQPHIYFAFYRQIDPTEYQTYALTAPEKIGQIIFKSIDQTDFSLPNTLIAAEPDKTPSNANIIDQIHFLNGETAFNLISTN